MVGFACQSLKPSQVTPILKDDSNLVPSTAVAASVASNPTMELKKEGREGTARGPISPSLFVVRPSVRPGHIIVNKKVHSGSQ